MDSVILFVTFAGMGKKSPFKSKQSLKPGEVRKNVDLPKPVLEILVGEAAKGRVQVKPYMENVLISHAQDIAVRDAPEVNTTLEDIKRRWVAQKASYPTPEEIYAYTEAVKSNGK